MQCIYVLSILLHLNTYIYLYTPCLYFPNILLFLFYKFISLPLLAIILITIGIYSLLSLNFLSFFFNIKNDRIISPCDTFFSMIDMSLLWESFPFYCDNDKIMYSDVKRNYTLDERLKYGFPISNFEYKRLVNSINKLKNKILKR